LLFVAIYDGAVDNRFFLGRDTPTLLRRYYAKLRAATSGDGEGEELGSR
jgi:hypothetical protein